MAVAAAETNIARGGSTAANYGWAELADEVQALHEQHPDAFLGATRYTYAAQLGFQLHDPDVTAFNLYLGENNTPTE